jgi:hypothetical protein
VRQQRLLLVVGAARNSAAAPAERLKAMKALVAVAMVPLLVASARDAGYVEGWC